MKTGFKDRLEVKEGKKLKSPWNFDKPIYDHRTSSFVNAGNHYGVGVAQPVGTFKHSGKRGVPEGRVNTMAHSSDGKTLILDDNESRP